MRQGPQNHKQRNRNRNRKGPNPLTRSYESNGGDVKIRGTALHVAEKYVQLARDAQAAGDRVAAENYLQHAEHYYRIVAAAQAQMQPHQMPQQNFRADDDGDDDDDRDENFGGNGNFAPRQQNAQGGGGQQPYGGSAPGSEPQPYVNGSGAQFNGGSEQPMEGQQPNGGGNNERGDYRQRRRRPYRDQHGNRPNPQAQAGAEMSDEGAAEE